MKNSDILLIVNAYQALRKKESDPENENPPEKLPTTVAWKRRLNFKDLIKATETIDEALSEIGEKYQDDEHSETKKIKDVDGTEQEVRIVKSEFIAEYTKEKAELLAQDTDVTIRKIKIKELGERDLSEDMLDTLMFMIEEEDDG